MQLSVYIITLNEEARIEATIKQAKKVADEIVVVLKDTGPGIPDIDLAMQEGWSTAPENIRQLGFGAGMGLPNIKKYSDELKIDSTVGVGTTITITVRNPA